MSAEDEVGEIIDRCIARAMPRDASGVGYIATENLDTHELTYFPNTDLISACVVREELEHEIGNYLRIKESEINSRLTQAKCDAYELALTHSRPVERIEKVTPQEIENFKEAGAILRSMRKEGE